MKTLPYLILSFLIISCASVPKASQEFDKKAKTFTAVPDKAVLYIYRNEYLGGALKKSLYLDDKHLGVTAPMTYVRVVTKPGNHVINSDHEHMLNLSMASGGIYFVRQEIKMGAFIAGSKLELVDQESGKSGVLESSLIHSELSE